MDHGDKDICIVFCTVYQYTGSDPTVCLEVRSARWFACSILLAPPPGCLFLPGDTSAIFAWANRPNTTGLPLTSFPSAIYVGRLGYYNKGLAE